MTIRTIGNLRKYINIFTLFFLLLITLIINSEKIVWAHTPHDKIDVLEISPAYEQDKTLYIVRSNRLKMSTDGGYSWKYLVNGLDNKHKFSDIAISPLYYSDKILFVSSSGDGIYKSLDGGNSWIKSNDGLLNLSISMLFIPSFKYDGFLLAVDNNGGLHKTVNGGVTWYQLSNKNKTTAVAFMTGSDHNNIIVGDDSGMLHRSRDGGVTWQECYQISNSGLITTIISSPNFEYDSTLFVGTEKGGMYKSVDGCVSFNEINNGFSDNFITSIAISHQYNEDKTVFASGWDEAVFISRDGGNTWRKFSEGLTWDKQAKLKRFWSPNFRDLRIAPLSKNSMIMFLGGFDGLFKSETGEVWSELETLPVSLIKGMAVSPGDRDNSALAITTYGGGAYITDDNGLTWMIKNKGLSSTRLSDIVFSPNYGLDNTIFSAERGFLLKIEGENNAWKKSKLSLSSWRKDLVTIFRKIGLPDSAYAYLKEKILTHAEKETPFPTVIAIAPDFKTDKTLYFGTRYHGIFMSSDGGQKSSLLWDVNGNTIKSLVISPDFASDLTLFVHIHEMGVYKTIDGGKSWQLLKFDNPDIMNTIRLIISPNYGEDQTVYIASSNGLFVTTDGGSSWKDLQAFRDTNIIAMAISPNYKFDSQIILSVKGTGLFKSHNRGVSFDKISPYLINNNHEVELIEYSTSYAEDKTIFAASDENLFKSSDSGNTWNIIARPVRYENHRDVINYEGEWKIKKGNNFSASSINHSDLAYDKATLTFVGTGVNLIGTASNDQGIAKVFIDGKYEAEIDQFSNTRQYMINSLSISDLSYGPHRLDIEVKRHKNPRSTGYRIEIDAFDIMP